MYQFYLHVGTTCPRSGGDVTFCDRSFSLACCLDRVAGTRGGRLTGGGDADTRGRATVRVGRGLVMS